MVASRGRAAVAGSRAVHLATSDPRRPQALGPEAHHHHEHDAVEQEAVLGELAEQLRQPDEHDGTEDDAGDAAHAADDDDGGHVDGDQDVDAAGEDGPDEAREDGAAEPGEGGAQHVGQHLGLDQVHAQRLGDVLILTDGQPGPTQPGASQPPGHEGDDGRTGQGDVVDLDRPVQEVRDRRGDGRRDVEDALRPTEPGFEQVGLDQDGDDLTEPKGGDGQVVTADTQDGQAQEDTEGHGREDGEGHGEPEGQVGDAESAPWMSAGRRCRRPTAKKATKPRSSRPARPSVMLRPRPMRM